MHHTFQLPDYPLYLGSLQETFPAWLQQRPSAPIFILTDENTHRDCLPYFLTASGLPTDTPTMQIPAGEHYKTIATCERIWQTMLERHLDRNALVINLGGGVVGDMGGFCAATWKRGVDFVQVPTTLLSMTDAAIGGKLGIDFQGIKNTVGVFRNPAAVFGDPFFLQTLSERELRSGFAEVLKHAIIGAPALWQQLASGFTLTGNTADVWLDILQQSAAVKVQVVTDDPHEKGIRMLLNYGHTIGHAVESYYLDSATPLTHGEAIAIGMLCESYLQPTTKGVSFAFIQTAMDRFFTRRDIPPVSIPLLWRLLQHDKKNAAGAVRMAVPGDAPLTMQLVELTEEDLARSVGFYNMLRG